jgi:triacylglycerol lipase
MAWLFEPTNRAFSLTNAKGSALAAQLAYQSPATVDRTTGTDWGFGPATHYTSTAGTAYDTQAFVAPRSDLVLVAFRGTEPKVIKDWLTDADCVQRASDVGHVHTGFLRAFETVWPAMLTDIRTMSDGGRRPIWFTGHSLGAALSTLAVASCSAANLPVAGHYTFGSPRVGDAPFGAFYNERYAAVTFRFVNNNDVVTRVPPRELSYDHVDFRRYFDSHGQLVADMRLLDALRDSFEGSILGLRKLFEELARQQEQRPALPLPDFLDDHRIDNYIACLGKSA